MSAWNNFSIRRICVSVGMQWRETRRRGPTLLMILGLPLLFFLVMYHTSSSYPMPIEVWEKTGATQVIVDHRIFVTLLLATMGMAWGVAAAAVSSVIGSTARDRRLMLCGYRATELMTARLAVLMSIVVILSLIFLILVWFLLAPRFPVLIWLGMLLSGFTAVGTGFALGSLLPRQLEATIGVIAVFGLEMALSAGQATFARYLPLHFANEVLKAGAFATAPETVKPVLLSLGYGTALFILAVSVWSKRTGLLNRRQVVDWGSTARFREKIVGAIVLVVLGLVIILAVPTAYEGPMLLYINEQHAIRLVDAIGLAIGVPSWLYLNLLVVRLGARRRESSNKQADVG
ncbi:ABC transporter permease [Dehalococcoidia bacterium]|nr:ABC transporter permease [Dehalococcoidia bacterium]MCL0088621.1 ABC transporter permease [Dehalococcoidia bacterium]